MNQKSKRKCLVTGGAGFIGSHLVDVLLSSGYEVTVLDNLSNGKMKNISAHEDKDNFTFIKGSILEPSDIKQATHGVDIVFHLACLGVRHSLRYPLENHRVNAEGTLRLLEEARTDNVQKFIYCSSSEVYGTAQYVPMPESHPINPCTVYGSSKFAGEAYTQAYFKTFGLKTVVVRPFNSYGPRSHHEGDCGEVIPKSIVRALNNAHLLIYGDGTQTRDFTYVEDTARGLLSAANDDDLLGDAWNMGSNFEISIKEIVRKILTVVNKSTSTIEHLESRPGDVLRLFADSNRFHQQTGWKPTVSLEEGLAKTVDWFQLRPEGVEALLNAEIAINWK